MAPFHPSRRRALALLGLTLSSAAIGRATPPAPFVGSVAVPGGRLHVEDTGGSGPAIVLLHAFTGSAATWSVYQSPAFARAGLRVVAYSRRGFGGSVVDAGSAPGSAIDDLDAVADARGLGRFHLLGTAAGGFIVPDYALARPERLITIVLACSQAGVVEPAYRAALDRMLPAAFRTMPPSFRELSPAYRALNPAGTAAWEALEASAHATPERIDQPPRHRIDYAALARIRTPTLAIAGAADLYVPPAMVRAYAAHLPNAEVAVLPESGHSAFWEEPAAFNRLVLDFVGRHR